MIKWEIIIEAVVTVIIAVATGVLIPWAKSWLGTKLDKATMENLEEWAKVAVEAAEQIFTNPKTGSLKKSYVIECLHNTFKELKINITDEQLNNIIESAVYKLKHEVLL